MLLAFNHENTGRYRGGPPSNRGTYMLIKDIYSTQRNLRRKEQIQGLVEEIKENGYVKPILLFKADDGRVSVEDGHHRLTAYYISGKEVLDGNEYVLIEGEQSRKPLRFKMSVLMKQYGFVV